MRKPLLDLLRKLSKRLSKSVEIDGLWVAADDHEMLTKVSDALRLIEAHDPRRYARIVNDLDGVWATLLRGPMGQFVQSDGICELDDRFCASASAERIASVIVHEATHARLARRGIGYTEHLRQRVETACVRQQQIFESKLTVRGMTADELSSYLELPSKTWSDKAFRRNDLRGTVIALRHLNVPDWLILVMLRVRRAGRRQRRSATSER